MNHDLTNAIAVIGFSGRFPGADDIDAFWNNLRNGVESIRPFTKNELIESNVDPVVMNHPNYVNMGAPFEDSDKFDAAFFGYLPKEAEKMDPQHRVILELAWSAFEHAGYDPDRYPGLVGVFSGIARNSYLTGNLLSHPEINTTVGEYDMMIGNERDFPAARIAFKLNLRGPAINVATACSTSGVAIHLACQSLLTGDSDMALAGAARVICPRTAGYWYTEGGPLSPDGHIRAFDASANGMVRGTGGAILVLKRYQDAVADRDTIHAIVLGSAINNDGADRIGYAAPSISGQAACIADALAVAGVDADTITYVETHGTGTNVGDPIEIAGLTKAFRETTDKNQVCAIGSVKTNIGHLDAAATVAGVVKTILAMKHKTLPPSLNFETPNPQIDFKGSPFFVNTELKEWKSEGYPRRAGVSSFGLGGTNAHIILEEPPESAVLPAKSRDTQLIILSAKTETALELATGNLSEFLTEHPAANLADVAFTLQNGRKPLSFRRVLTAVEVPDAVKALKDQNRQVTKRCSGSNRPLVFMFPGGGTQYAGMGRGLYESERVFRETIDTCAEILSELIPVGLLDLLDIEADKGQLERPSLALPALLSVEVAMARLWESWGVSPSAMIGHSMGEYVAAHLAKVFSLEDALALVTMRGKLFERLPSGSMLGVPLSEDELKPYLNGSLDFAAVNLPTMSVVSGESEEIRRLAKQLEVDEIDSRHLHINVAAHSRMVEPILEEFSDFLADISFERPELPFVSNVTGQWISGEDAMKPSYWVKHLRSTVRFADGLTTVLDNPDQILLEVGPGRALSTFARQHPATKKETAIIVSIRHPLEVTPDLEFTLNRLGDLWVAGAEIDWQAFCADESRTRIPLPTYPFERKRYWIDPVGPLSVSLNGTMPPNLGGRAFSETRPYDQFKETAGSDISEPAIDVISPETGTAELETALEPAPRKERVLEALKLVIRDLSGIEAADLDSQATFLELGFDSLFLTQANSAIKKKFGVKLTVRQLLESCSRLDTLAAYVDSQLPEDAFAAAAPAAVKNAAPAQVSTTPSVAAGSIEKALQDQLQSMQRLIEQQMAMLRGIDSPSDFARPASSSPQYTASAPGSLTDNVPASAREKSRIAAVVDKSSPWQPVQAGENGKLPPKQQEHLDKVIAKTVERCPRSKALAQEHRSHLADPRTVAGYKRAWKEMVFPIVADRSKGSRVWDVDGNEYIDLMGGYGVNLLGHSPDFVSEAAKAQIDRGIEIGPQNKLAGEVAKMVCEMTGMDRAAMCNTGSEAILAAIRVARTVTGNDRIAMFKTHYHGIFNEVLAKGVEIAGKKRTLPIALGIPGFAVENTLMLDYGEQKALDEIREHRDELALVMVESIRSRDPEFRPRQFVRALRELTSELGIPLMFDEIVTGFRIGPRGAQGYYGVEADLASYGKVIGGGYPVGVLAGKKEYMDALDGGYWQFGDDSAPVADMTWFAGTFVRHPLAMATTHATLSYLKDHPGLQEELNQKTAAFAQSLNDHFKETNSPVYVTHFASWFMVKFEPYQEFSPLMFWHLRNRGILTYEGRPAFFTEAHTAEDFAQIIQAFKESAAEMQNSGLFSGGPVRDPNEPFEIPMTQGQQEIWLATRFGDDASCAYNLSSTMRIKGELNVDKLNEALTHLTKRHESLRAVPNEHGVSQRIMPVTVYDLVQYDLSDLNEDDTNKRLEELRQQEVTAPFDLENGPLTRAHLVRLKEDEHFFIFTVHHIVADGWSCGVILKDLGKLYTASIGEESGDLNNVMPLSEWVDQSIVASKTESYSDARDYWLEEFRSNVTVLELPTDRPRPPAKSYRAHRTTVPVTKDEIEHVSKTASEQGVTLFTFLMGAFDTLLHRISGQDDVVVGFSLAGQSNLTRRDLVAHAVNFLPIRARFEQNMSFPELLGLLRGKIFDAVEFQEYPFGALIKELRLERDRSRLPLMSVAFNLDPSGSGVKIPGLDIETGSVPRAFENFDIFFNIAELSDRYEIQVTANSDLFDRDTIRRYVGSYLTMLRSLALDPEQQISAVPMLTAAESKELLVDWNTNDETSFDVFSLVERFETQAERFEDQPAVSHDSKCLTYGELNRRANQLAHYLISLGVDGGTLVGLNTERSIDTVTAILGIMKAGAAYVPLDPANPSERLAQIIEDAKMPVIVTHSETKKKLPKHGAQTVIIDADRQRISEESVENPDLKTTADSLAYVMFTSGSTGRPKGVMVNHENVARLFTATEHWFEFSDKDVWTMFHSYAFDFSVWEMWGALLYGGRVVVVPFKVSRSPEAFYELVCREKVTMLSQTPSAFRQFIRVEEIAKADCDLSLRTIVFGGEALETESLRPWLERHGDEKPRLVNMYGITETTVHVTYRPVTRADLDAGVRSVIGVPIPDLKVYILDRELQPVPVGVPGEIYVAGAGVTLGYLNRPDLTAERFIPNPFVEYKSGKDGKRVKGSNKHANSSSVLYKTGDRGRFRPDRGIEYFGRIDNQVQIRGFRVEPGEIENALSQHEEVHEAVVMVREDSPGEFDLTAYIVAKSSDHANGSSGDASNQHKANWLAKWAALYESGRASKALGDVSGEVVNDLAILEQLAQKEGFEEELVEFQGQTFDRVMSLKPKRVLEIGCGTGQNLIRIAPEVEYFLGTDYAPFAIDEAQRYLDRDDVDLAHVDLRVQEGNDFRGIAPNSFDAVLILSVMQYFPSPSYFRQVIEGSVFVAKPGGVVYISDVQSLAHLETHHASDQLFRSPENMSRDELKEIVSRRVLIEDELVVDPNYFIALQGLIPEISRVEFKLRRGHILNETTKFHYDVFLHLAPQDSVPVSANWIDWKAAGLTLESLRSQLTDEKPELVCATNVPNSRIQSEVATLRMLHDTDGPATVSELKDARGALRLDGIDPEALWELGDELGYEVDVRWTENHPDGSMDVVFTRPKKNDSPANYVPSPIRDEILPQSWRSFSNNPMMKEMNDELVPNIRGYLRNKLPDYMLPNKIVVLDSIPLTNNGKVDLMALPVPVSKRVQTVVNLHSTATAVEQKITDIWCEVLGLEDVGKNQNFFELGGHSLLAIQIIIRVRAVFGVDLALGSIFEYPTVSELATAIEALGSERENRGGNEGSSSVSIRRLARDAVKPSTLLSNMRRGES
ncbi:MAG: amino acid adenylation domain-containing protein [Pyrinomonadaceae bacterium]